MTHIEWIKSSFEVLAENGNSIYYRAYGEDCCEINGQPFSCNSIEEFWELVEFFGDEDFTE